MCVCVCVCVWKERKKSERFEGIVEVIMGRRRKRKGWKRVCVCVCGKRERRVRDLKVS